MPNLYSHTIIMGDLVSSQSTPSVHRLHQVFNRVVDEVNDQEGAKFVSPLTITLGDEFQGVCSNLSDGLVIMRLLRAKMLLADVECRFVLGVIALETPVNHERAWNMMGKGLASTRKRLAEKRDINAYRFVLPDHPVVQGLMETVGAALSDIERTWTSRQRHIILSTASETISEIVERLGISTPTYYKIRRAGKFDLYEQEWHALTAAVEGLDREYGLA
jgi:hypothetical protein